MRLETDLEILEAIYEQTRHKFSEFTPGEKNGRQSKIFIPVDFEALGKKFGKDKDEIFCRVYHDLEPRITLSKDRPLFSLTVGSKPEDKNCINYPVLCSAVSRMQKEEHIVTSARVWAAVSGVCAVATILVSVALYIFSESTQQQPYKIEIVQPPSPSAISASAPQIPQTK